jgi:DNA-binding CsgD family transcriptional regulator
VRPLIVVEGPARAFADALAEVRGAGWKVVTGWTAAGAAANVLVCSGIVASAEDAAAALLAAVGGAGLVVWAQAGRDVVDRLCDDLRRLGSLDHRLGDAGSRPALTGDEQAIVNLLLDGHSLGEAARRLNLARRTADRRLASVREKLGVETTAAALAEIARRRTNRPD